jgi:phosphate transport system substrate-binding protein
MQLATMCFALAGLLGLACNSEPPTRRGSAETQPTATLPPSAMVTVEGAGSSFIFPLMQRWSEEYPKIAPNVDINYQPIGSHEGVFQLRNKSVDFAASDAPLTDDQLRDARAPVVHIPLAMGAVVPTYNLPPLPHPVRFTPEALSRIYLGEIKNWRDPRIAAENPDLSLPSSPIVVVHRRDGSGTTYVWTDYLSKVSADWKSKVGASTLVDWPVGIEGLGNEGVADVVRKTPGAIGYVESTYATRNKMPVGLVRNKAGRYVQPSLDSVTAASASVLADLPDDLRYSITDAPGETAWPVSGTTWAVVYGSREASGETGPDRNATLGFLRWALHDGQRFCADLGYAPLPAELVRRADAKLSGLTNAR